MDGKPLSQIDELSLPPNQDKLQRLQIPSYNFPSFSKDVDPPARSKRVCRILHRTSAMIEKV